MNHLKQNGIFKSILFFFFNAHRFCRYRLCLLCDSGASAWKQGGRVEDKELALPGPLVTHVWWWSPAVSQDLS